MKTLNLIQGDANWHAHRASSKNASDAPAMLGCSEYKTRSELLHEAFTGIRPEVTPDQQRRFDDGHAIEEAQLPGAEGVIGEQLYPVVGCERFGDIELSASFDGLTLLEDTAYECKTLNDKLRAALLAPGPDGNDAAALPKMYRVQMEQQLMVCGGDRVLFTAATKDGADVRRCWYSSDVALRAEILAGWKQFDADLKVYVPPTAAAVEKVVAEPVEALPAPVVQVTGQIALQDNFKVFEARLRDFLENKLIRKPTTDQDFADLDGQIKAMKAARESLKAAEAQMLAQVQPVDQAKKTKDMLDTLLQQNVSMAERLLTAEKDRRKLEIVNGATIALRTHIDKLNARFERPYLAYAMVPADFGGVVRGLKSLTSMEDKVGTELARCKIEAHEIADRINANREDLKPGLAAIPGDDWISLFPDFAQVCTKPTEDFRNLRIARVEAERQRREAERERIRKEEQERADREARERVAAEQRQREEAEAQERRQRETAQAPAAPQAQPIAALEPVRSVASVPPASTANVVPLSRPAAPATAPSAPPSLTLGAIKTRIAPLQIDAAGLATLGFQPTTQGASKLYHEREFPSMLAAMVKHLEAIQAKAAA